MMATKLWRVLSLALVLTFAIGIAGPPGPTVQASAAAQGRLLKVGFIPITDFSGMYVAIDNGYFAEEGLQVELQAMQGGAVIVPALIGGSLDVGISNILSVLVARDNGFDIQIVADAAYEGPPPAVHAIVAPGDSTIQTGKDMEGKTIGINTFQGIEHLAIMKWIEMTGGDPARVTLVEIPFPQMAQTVQQGRIAAGTVVEPFMTIALSQGLKVVANHYLDIAPRTYIAPLVATREWIDRNPDAAQAFSRAMIKGNNYALNPANDAQTRASIAKWTRMDPALAGQIALTPLGNKPDPALIQWWIDEGTKLGWLKNPQSPDDLLAPFLR